jgi:hypothetical protein
MLLLLLLLLLLLTTALVLATGRSALSAAPAWAAWAAMQQCCWSLSPALRWGLPLGPSWRWAAWLW